MRKVAGFLILGVFLFWASLVSAAQVTVKDFQAEKGTVSVWKIAKALNHPGWDGVNALRKSDPNLPPLKKVGKIFDIRVFPNTWITIPEDWSYEGIDRSVVDPIIDPNKPSPSLSPSLVAEGFNSPEGTTNGQKNDMWDFWVPTVIGFAFVTLVLGILIASMISFNKRRRMASQAIIPGGIGPNRPQEVEDRFNRIAERRYGEANPQADLSAERPVRISPIETGFLNGHGTVMYRDKPRKEKMKNEPGFRARYRFPNGSEEELLFKQACGNDVYAGTRYRGFTFTASQVIVSAPAPVIKTRPNPTQNLETASAAVTEAQTTIAETSISSAPKSAADEVAPPEITEETQQLTGAAVSSETAETVKTTETVVAKEVVAAEAAQTPKKVKVTVGGISIEVAGNGKVPAAKIEMEDGTTVLLQQQ